MINPPLRSLLATLRFSDRVLCPVGHTHPRHVRGGRRIEPTRIRRHRRHVRFPETSARGMYRFFGFEWCVSLEGMTKYVARSGEARRGSAERERRSLGSQLTVHGSQSETGTSPDQSRVVGKRRTENRKRKTTASYPRILVIRMTWYDGKRFP